MPYITDKHEVEKEPLALVGLLGAKYLHIDLVRILEQLFKPSSTKYTQLRLISYLISSIAANQMLSAKQKMRVTWKSSPSERTSTTLAETRRKVSILPHRHARMG